MSTKTVEDAYAQELKYNQSLEARTAELETALAGLCDAVGKSEEDVLSWLSGDANSPEGHETELVEVWKGCREVLDPS